MRAPLIHVVLPLLGFLAVVLPLGGCSSNDDEIKPSPIPAGYSMLLAQRQRQLQAGQAPQQTESGDTVDELLAVVDGEVLTRREVLRRLRLPENGRRQRSEEEEIGQARLQWAKQQLVMGAARRAGLHIPESNMDSIAEDFLRNQMKKNEELTGEKLSQEEYLAYRKLTWEEFRSQARGDIIYQYYLRKLLRGIGPTRPEVDYDVSPAEVRRIYYDHRKAFHVKRGAKFAVFPMLLESYETDEAGNQRDFLESEQLAAQAAERLAADFRKGADPEALAERYKLEEGLWQIAEEFRDKFPHPEGSKFLFDPVRRKGDALILQYPDGPVVLGVVAIRQPRRRQLEEVYDDIVLLLQRGMEARMAANLTIDQLRHGATVWPDDLADELLDEAHEMLDALATDEVLGGARLR